MTVAIPIILVSDKKLWVIDEIHNPHDNFGKENNNEKSFTSKSPEMDSLNTKGNVKQKWGKRKRNKALLKSSLRFSLTWKRRDKIGYCIGRKAEMTNTKSYRNQRKFISHRSQPIDLHSKSIYWFCVRQVFPERFLGQTTTIFKSSGWKKLWNILAIAECIEWLPIELTLQYHFDRIIPLVNIVGFLFVVVLFFWQKVLAKTYVMPPKTKK